MKRVFVVYYFSDKRKNNDGGIIGVFQLKEDAIRCRKMYVENHDELESSIEDVDWDNDDEIFADDLDEWIGIHTTVIN